MEDYNVQQAIMDLRSEKIIAFPTETVYGLAALLSCERAIETLFKIKERPRNKPFALYFHSVEAACPFIVSNTAFHTLAKVFLPGPLTLILKAKKPLSNLLTSDSDKVAIRIPSHPTAQALLTALGEPLVATSANLSGKPPALDAHSVSLVFNGKIAGVLEASGKTSQTPSTILSLYNETPFILREGSITKESLEKILAQSMIFC